jgi:hypothetical protein
VSGVFDEKDVNFAIADVQLPPDLKLKLAESYNEISQRAAALKNPQSLPPIVNAGFEEPAPRDGEIAGWLFAQGDGIEVQQAAGGYRESAKALKITSRGTETWVRSQPIAVPRTGRIAVWVRLRTTNINHQPLLRLAIEARRGRQSYYRYATVGAGTNAPLGDRWSPFVLQIDDLPREGLEEFRIGFDLMGPGEVWIDDVEIYDSSFTPEEQVSISKQISAANFHLRNDNLVVAARVLDSYWPQFLLKHVEPAPAAEVELPVAAPSAPPSAAPRTPPPPAAERETKRGWFRWVPSVF